MKYLQTTKTPEFGYGKCSICKKPFDLPSDWMLRHKDHTGKKETWHHKECCKERLWSHLR